MISPDTTRITLYGVERPTASSVGRQIGNQILRGIFGGLFRVGR